MTIQILPSKGRPIRPKTPREQILEERKKRRWGHPKGFSTLAIIAWQEANRGWSKCPLLEKPNGHTRVSSI